MDNIPRDVMILILEYYAQCSSVNIITLVIIRSLLRVNNPGIDPRGLANRIMKDRFAMLRPRKIRIFDKIIPFYGEIATITNGMSAEWETPQTIPGILVVLLIFH